MRKSFFLSLILILSMKENKLSFSTRAILTILNNQKLFMVDCYHTVFSFRNEKRFSVMLSVRNIHTNKKQNSPPPPPTTVMKSLEWGGEEEGGILSIFYIFFLLSCVIIICNVFSVFFITF